MPNQTITERAFTPAPEHKPRGRAILGLSALLLLAVLYIWACLSVPADRVLSGTRAVYPGADASQALDLSGLDRDAAERALEQDFHSRFGDESFQVRACGQDYTVPVGDVLTLDCAQAAERALAPARQPLPLRGAGKLRSLLGGTVLNLRPELSDEEALRTRLRESGLLDVNTTIYTTFEVTDKQLVLHKGKSGQSVDEDALVTRLNEAVHAGDFTTVVDSPMREVPVDVLDWEKVEKKVCKQPANATLVLSDDRRSYELADPVSGVSFERAQAQQALEEAPEGGEARVNLRFEEAEISKKQLEKGLFQDKLGTYTTTVSGTRDRISNVRLAAEKCDGVILCSEDSFSYNETLGERTSANGFKKAGAYLNGVTVQELGGGICQISSTLYAAVLDANLKIVERHNHTFASSYIGLGRDATVSWGGPDFQFQNDRAYPIRIEARYADGKATVSIWGTRTDQRTVKIVSETQKVIPYPTVVKKSSSLKKGKTKVTQKGSDGYRVQTYREVYEGGKLISSEKEAYSVYTPHEQIVLKGTGGSKKSGKHSKKSSKSSKKTGKSKNDKKADRNKKSRKSQNNKGSKKSQNTKKTKKSQNTRKTKKSQNTKRTKKSKNNRKSKTTKKSGKKKKK